MIRARGLVKTYRAPFMRHDGAAGIDVLKAVDLEIADGDYVAVMGESGAGKSTLLQILGCLDRPTAGKYELDGRDVAACRDDELAALRNRTMGFVFQSSHFVDYLDLADNVALPAFYAPDYRRGPARARAVELLTSVGLGDRAVHLPGELSGGERQRAALARALMLRPRYLLADEPTGNLDDRNTARLAELFAALNAAGTAILLVTHDTRIARAARRRYLLTKGMLAAC